MRISSCLEENRKLNSRSTREGEREREKEIKGNKREGGKEKKEKKSVTKDDKEDF